MSNVQNSYEAPTLKTESAIPFEMKSMIQFELPVTFKDNRTLLTVITDQHGNPWWVANEVCKVLGLTNPSVSVQSLDDDERAKFNLGRQGDTWIINEPGLYSLILRSRKPEAKAFKRWVTHEVLPEIRKTGSYSAKLAFDPRSLTRLDILQMAIDSEKRALVAEDSVRQLAAENQVLAPKGQYYDNYASRNGLFSLTDAAKHIGAKPRKFTEQLRRDKVLYKRGNGKNNKPYQQYVDKGFFVLNTHPDTKGNVWAQTLVTPKGMLFLAERYGDFSKRIEAQDQQRQLGQVVMRLVETPKRPPSPLSQSTWGVPCGVPAAITTKRSPREGFSAEGIGSRN
jgi:prophage antirepressor-like protein